MVFIPFAPRSTTKRAGARFERDGFQRWIELLEDEPSAGKRRVAAEIDFGLRREPAQIVFARR